MTAELISVNCLLAVILSRTSRTGGARFPQLLVTAAVILSPHIISHLPLLRFLFSCHPSFPISYSFFLQLVRSCHLVTSHPSGARFHQVPVRCYLVTAHHTSSSIVTFSLHMSFPCPSFPIACALFTVTCQLYYHLCYTCH